MLKSSSIIYDGRFKRNAQTEDDWDDVFGANSLACIASK